MAGLKLLLADDHEIVRQGLRSLLAPVRDCEIVGEASDGRQAVAMTKELNPDIVILDIGMPTLNGLEATRQILKLRPQTKVLVLTMHEADSVIREVLLAAEPVPILPENRRSKRLPRVINLKNSERPNLPPSMVR